MASNSDPVTTIEHDLRAQLDELRAQVRTLLNDKVGPRVAEAAQSAEDAARHVRDAAQCQARMVGDEIRERPFTSVLLAAAVGALIGRVLR
jgi:ElaB/YqjD/DUF883 family membrane-anchored ribosome-binding protein